MGLGKKINNEILGVMLSLLGIKALSATTNAPEATIVFHFLQHGESKQVELTVQELLNEITGTPLQARSLPTVDDRPATSPMAPARKG